MLLRRRVALPAVLGVLGLVWAGAHSLAHDIVSTPVVSTHDAAHGRALAAYAAYVPTSLALCLTLAAAIATGVALGRRWSGMSGRSLWLFGIVPVLGLALDTLVELPAHGPTSAAAAAELVPVFLIGLLVQLPFALVAVGLAARILWLVERLAWALCEPSGVGQTAEGQSFAQARASHAPALALAGARRSRAPPSPLTA